LLNKFKNTEKNINLKNINSLVELFFLRLKISDKKEIFLESLNQNYSKQKYTWEEVANKIFKVSSKIKNFIKKGDRCLLLSENRPEWLILDIAIMNAGGISVPVFTTYSEDDYKYIINDCKPALIIVSNNNQFKKIKNYISHETKNIISFEEINHKSNLIEDIYREQSFEKVINYNLERRSVACIIYTSGTSGNPKGVMLSHGGILSNCSGALEVLNPLITKKKLIFLTWLPLSHSYEHTVQFIQILLGAKIFYAENLEKLILNMSKAKPTIMTAVPRFYQNLFNKINLNFRKQKGIKKLLIYQTLQLGKKILNKKKLNFKESFLNIFCNILVRRKIKKQFGGNLKAFISGGGALDQNIGEFLNAIGLPTLQGYGLTEASPVVSCNLPGHIKVDTVGPAFKTNKVKIASDGEILIKGENIMLGYWNKKKETEDIIKNGWLHTGDIGEIDSEGFLKITDRKKDLIVNFGGDNISPVKIENLLCLNENIKQSFVYGDKKNYLIAILVVEKNFTTQDLIVKYIDNLNKKLSSIEKIKKFFVSFNEFTIENRMLTPTLKLRRKEIVINYLEQIKNLY
jgi:long-chain acyl-CoA synthetase